MDVFISSGRDNSRYTFVSHLSAAFARKKISVVEDDEPPPGSREYVTERTRSLIKSCKVCVVVISEEFAFSKTSLSSLVEVLDRQHDKAWVAVVPVFYRLDRSVAEQLSDKFDEAFSDKSMLSEPQDRVDSWRNALKEMTRFEEALEAKQGQSDLELVEEIVKCVQKKLFPTDKIGIDSRLMEVENLIMNLPFGVRIIGIWGMAGIGKSTIVEAVFNHMKGDYKSARLIRNFEKQFQTMGLYHLREHQLPQEVKDRLNINKPSSPKAMVAFLVLDDVRNPLNAESFLGGFSWFDPGSVIIITSRDKNVLHQCKVTEIYEVKKLDDKESQKLFSECAFGDVLPQEPYPKVTDMVVEYANGNPKALRYYGAKLKGKKTLEEMEAEFFKLKRSPHPDIVNLFKNSYDDLSENEKNIFLDIACFFSGKSVEHITEALEGRGLFVPIGIQYLSEKSLVTKHENIVVMQKLLQDVGRKIRSQEVENGMSHRLCGAYNIQPLLEDKEPKANVRRILVLEDIESILLDVSGLSFDVKPVVFESMCNLRLLKICSSDPKKHLGLGLPKRLQSLPSKLWLLHWENYSLKKLPDDFSPHNLVELSMPYSQLQKLWKGTRILKCLKTINLQNSEKLTEINQVSEAHNLEEINLQGCKSLQSFAVTGYLEHLHVLNLCGCVEIKSFPNVLPPNIKEFNLNGTGIREVPSSIEALSKLVKLDVGNCKELVEFLIKIYNMDSLEMLNLSGCIGIKTFPEITKEVRNLKYLYLSCTGLQELHSSVSNLIGLKVLKVSRTLNLPESLKVLKDLKVEED